MESSPARSRKTSSGKRHYDASRRQDDARARRRRVVEAAHDLFLDRGYGSVTIQEIAQRAGVSAQMVYAAFGSKAGILSEAVDQAIVGDDEDVPLFERPDHLAALAPTQPREFVAGVAGSVTAMHERSARILHLVETVAGSDPAVEELRQKLHRLRSIDGRRTMELVPDKGRRPGVTDDELRELLDHVLSPGGYVHLIDDFGWTPDRYRWWIERIIHDVAYGSD